MRARKKLDFGVSDNDKNINIYRIYGLLITVSSTHSTQIVWQRNNMGSNSNHIDLISSLADQWSATTIGFYEQIFLLLFFFFVVDLRSEDVAVLWQSTWSRTGAICWEIWIVWTCRSIWYPQGLSSTIRLNELQQFMLSIVHLVEKKMRSLDCQPKIEIWIYWANNSDFNVVRNHNILKFFQNDIIRIFMRR